MLNSYINYPICKKIVYRNIVKGNGGMEVIKSVNTYEYSSSSDMLTV